LVPGHAWADSTIASTSRRKFALVLSGLPLSSQIGRDETSPRNRLEEKQLTEFRFKLLSWPEESKSVQLLRPTNFGDAKHETGQIVIVVLLVLVAFL